MSYLHFPKSPALLPLLLASLGAHAAEIDLGDWRGSLNSTATFGTQIRTSAPNTAFLFASNAARQGLPGNPLTAQNDDDGNLNFKRGDQVSTVLKAVSALQLKNQDSELVLRAKAWHDFSLSDGNRPWGNTPNGYQAGTPLSDNGFGGLARFSGIALLDAYVGSRFAVAGQALDVRAGNQSLAGWGERASIGGGIGALQPVDAVAARRPGAQASEVAVPVPQLFGRLALAPQQSLEAFYQLRYRHSELPGCGTFFAASDYVADGCNHVYPGGAASDGAKLAANNFVNRIATPEVSNSGQFGFAYRFRADSLNSDIGLYAAQYHNRTPVVSVLKSSRNGAPYLPGNADGQNVQYLTEYPEKVHLLGLSFASKAADTTISGEISYRPNQPLGLNGTDLLNAFLSNSAASLLRPDASQAAPGSLYHGYDRFKMLQMQLGAVKPFAQVWGAQSLTLAGEVGLRHIAGLPDQSVRRYSRSTAFGLGPVAGVCQAGASEAMCSNDGYVSSNAWGYRLRAALLYPAALAGADLTPSVSLAHDVKGWSHDGVFSQGRKTVSLALRGDYRKKYFADLAYVTSFGGRYDHLRDRDYLNLAVGINF
jgi:hypothetical protein